VNLPREKLEVEREVLGCRWVVINSLRQKWNSALRFG
jgi:hypothetical protein